MPNDARLITWPYYALGVAPSLAPMEEWVIFFGADFYNMTEIDIPAFIEKTNQCLDYLRKKFPGSKLIYRPHPDESRELFDLDLGGFFIQRDGQSAEEFLWANQRNIKHALSVCSTSSIAALSLGLNAHAFYKYFRGVFRGAHKIFVDKYFSDLPGDFFIEDLNSAPPENKINILPDRTFIEEFRQIISVNSGSLWFIVAESRLLLVITALTKLVKSFFPDRQINLIISGHHRWQGQTLTALHQDFHQVLVFPRCFYSLKLNKLFSAWRTAKKIKKLSVNSSSIFIGLAHHSFIENCFISYHPKPFKLAFIPEKTWEITFQPERSGFNLKNLRVTKAGWFYNYFLEPFLGLNRTSYQQYSEPSHLAFIRLQKSLEQLYDRVFLFKNCPPSH